MTNKIVKAVLVGMTLVCTALIAPPANADTTYYTYWTRAEVKEKDRVLQGASFACGFFVSPALGLACGTGSAGKAFAYGADHDCKVRQTTTIGASVGSWDRATHYYHVYACLN